MKPWQKPTNELVKKAMVSVTKETDRRYFFSHLENPLWIEPLDERGHFDSPPEIVDMGDGYVRYPSWPELEYLKKSAQHRPDKIVDIILRLPEFDNPSVYMGILEIALQLPGEYSAKLKAIILKYTDLEYQLSPYLCSNLLVHWVQENQVEAALALAEKLVKFVEDPQSKQKKDIYKKTPHALESSLDPTPRFGASLYQNIIEDGVRPLASKAPLDLASILIDAVTEMINLSFHSIEFDQKTKMDYSKIWCPRLGKSAWKHVSPKQALINMLTYTCEELYKSTPKHSEELNKKLTKQPWFLFERIRQHLYVRNLNERNSERWIREMVLSHPDYAEWGYHYEFQQMLHCACDHFGENFLTKKERTKIFDAILSGPSKDRYRAIFGDKFTEDAFRQRRRKFHHMQLRPFSAVLFGKYSSYFKELETESNKPISDEDYSPVPEVRSGMTYRSPKSPEHLANLPDEELLAYINEWQGQHDIELDWTMEVSIDALSGAFRKVFMETIISNENRLNFWLKNRDRIQRSIYVRVMVDSMQENVKEKKFSHLDQWLDFCQWVISHPDSGLEKTFPFGEKSREIPNWTTSRRSVADFVKACLTEDGNAPISARSGLANILRSLCTQPDWTLDQEKHDHNDPVNSAINRTRGIALENVVYFGIWVRQHAPHSAVPEIATILDDRFSKNDILPITLPEYAVLGFHYFRIILLDPTWAQEHKADIFPHDNFPAWRASFSAVIRYVRISEKLYRHIEGEYRFAVEHLWELPLGQHEYGAGIENLKTLMPTHQERESHRTEIINRLGHHLFVYYLWGLFSTDDGENLLAMFYEKTRENPKYWRNLFDYAGRLLKVEGGTRENDMVEKAIKFFDWRFTEQEAEELQDFFHWWLDAECLPAKWRLDNLLQILNLCHTGAMAFMRGVPALSEMLEEQPEKVVECFAKMADLLPVDDYIYIDTAGAKKILKFGLNSDDQNTRQHAEYAREKLLGHGYFDFLQLDE